MIVRAALAALALATPGAAAAPRTIPPATFVPWEANGAVRAGGLVVTDAGGPCPAGDADAGPGRCAVPAARIAAPGRAPFRLASGTSGPVARLGIGPLARARGAGVILTTFTGGAHCCERYDVAVPGPAGWRHLVVQRTETTDTGPIRQTEFDYGLRRFPTDLDGDGQADFVLGDDAFAYLFADYADSRSPPVVLNIAGDGFADVSRRPGFRRLFEADLAGARRDCVAPDAGRSPNGACAAYAADAARLGRLDRAWPEIVAHYDRTGDRDGYPRCTAAATDGHCPPGREVRYPDFPAALRDFLRRDGYLAR